MRASMRTFLLLAVLAGVTPAGRAAALEIQSSVDRQTARVGDQVLLTVVVQGGIRSLPEPQLPNLKPDFDVYSGSTSRSYSFLNGKISASLTRQYVLIPRREGNLVIGPITAKSHGETVRTRPISVQVSRATAPPVPPPASKEEKGSTSGTEDIFVRATVDKDSPYTYEQVTYRVRLYTRFNLLDNPDFSPPTTQGFWKENLPPRKPTLETVNGRRYQVLEVDLAMFPTVPGKLTIGGATLECNVEAPMRPRDPFSVFGGGFFNGQRKVLRTKPLTLQVKPLPGGAPAGFQGAVGEYTLHVSADRSEVKQNEPITLTVQVTGQGNLRTVGDIDLPAMPEFRSYPSSTNEKTNRRGTTIRGTLTRQFILVPLSAGKKTIPSVRVVTFSPQKERYVTLASSPIPITVTAAGPSAAAASGSREDIRVLGHDIRFIETDLPRFTRAGGTWSGVIFWLRLLPVPPVAFLAFWGWERRRKRLSADVALRRRLRAAKEGKRILRQAAALSGGEQAARVGEALRVYLADRYNLPRAGLTGEDVEKNLEREGIDPAPVTEFLDRCDAARYAPSAAMGAPATDWVREAEGWMKQLEKTR